MAGVPLEVDRDSAHELARRELADPSYDVDRPLLARIMDAILEWLGRLIDQAAGAIGGGLGLALLAAFVVLVVAIVLLRTGPMARRAARHGGRMFDSVRLTAADHRRAADAAAATQDWATAVVERYRAVIATLEERAILDPRPGRTADEAAREAGSALPGLAGVLMAGAQLFDGVHYGGRPATGDDDARLRDLDAAVRRTRPARPAEAA